MTDATASNELFVGKMPASLDPISRCTNWGRFVISSFFLLLSFFEPHPWASAILVDELDAGGF
jgi:hypothetical protein